MQNLKIYYKNEVHKCAKIPEDYESLIDILLKIYKTELGDAFAIHYKTNSGINKQLSNQDDYISMLDLHKSNTEPTIKIYITTLTIVNTTTHIIIPIPPTTNTTHEDKTTTTSSIDKNTLLNQTKTTRPKTINICNIQEITTNTDLKEDKNPDNMIFNNLHDNNSSMLIKPNDGNGNIHQANNPEMIGIQPKKVEEGEELLKKTNNLKTSKELISSSILLNKGSNISDRGSGSEQLIVKKIKILEDVDLKDQKDDEDKDKNSNGDVNDDEDKDGNSDGNGDKDKDKNGNSDVNGDEDKDKNGYGDIRNQNNPQMKLAIKLPYEKVEYPKFGESLNHNLHNPLTNNTNLNNLNMKKRGKSPIEYPVFEKPNHDHIDHLNNYNHYNAHYIGNHCNFTNYYDNNLGHYYNYPNHLPPNLHPINNTNEEVLKPPKRIQNDLITLNNDYINKYPIRKETRPIPSLNNDLLIYQQIIKCNKCEIPLVIGIHHKCLICMKYDLCERCKSHVKHPHSNAESKKMKKMLEKATIDNQLKSQDNKNTEEEKEKRKEKEKEKKKNKEKEDTNPNTNTTSTSPMNYLTHLFFGKSSQDKSKANPNSVSPHLENHHQPYSSNTIYYSKLIKVIMTVPEIIHIGTKVIYHRIIIKNSSKQRFPKEVFLIELPFKSSMGMLIHQLDIEEQCEVYVKVEPVIEEIGVHNTKWRLFWKDDQGQLQIIGEVFELEYEIIPKLSTIALENLVKLKEIFPNKKLNEICKAMSKKTQANLNDLIEILMNN